MARSLLIVRSSFIARGRPCSASRQKQQQACRIRRRRQNPQSRTLRRQTIVSRRWSIAAHPPTPVTIAQTQRHSSNPHRSAALRMRRPPPAPNDRARPRLPTRQQGKNSNDRDAIAQPGSDANAAANANTDAVQQSSALKTDAKSTEKKSADLKSPSEIDSRPHSSDLMLHLLLPPQRRRTQHPRLRRTRSPLQFPLPSRRRIFPRPRLRPAMPRRRLRLRRRQWLPVRRRQPHRRHHQLRSRASPTQRPP